MSFHSMAGLMLGCAYHGDFSSSQSGPFVSQNSLLAQNRCLRLDLFGDYLVEPEREPRDRFAP